MPKKIRRSCRGSHYCEEIAPQTLPCLPNWVFGLQGVYIRSFCLRLGWFYIAKHEFNKNCRHLGLRFFEALTSGCGAWVRVLGRGQK